MLFGLLVRVNYIPNIKTKTCNYACNDPYFSSGAELVKRVVLEFAIFPIADFDCAEQFIAIAAKVCFVIIG